MNNTLTKVEKDKEKETEKKANPFSNQDTDQTTEEGQENTAGQREHLEGRETISGHQNTTAVSTGEKYTGARPEKPESEGRHEGESEERNSGSGKATGGGEDGAGGKEPDNSLNTVERQEPELGKTPENTQGSRDTSFGSDKTDTTGISVTKDKGQWEKEKKELQVNGKRDPDKVGPNDTKLRAADGKGENTVEAFNLDRTENGTVTIETKERQKSNNSSPDGRRAVTGRVNVTQYTMYRAGGEESGSTVRTSPRKEDKTEDREEKAKERENEANLSFTGKRLRGENVKRPLSPPIFILCLPRRERLPPSASPLPRLPPGDARGGAGNGGVLL